MSAINNGGPAFPSLEATMTGISSEGEERWETEPHGGMTLRDYFAAKAIQGLASKLGAPDYEFEAMAAYKYADAMLAARDK